MRPDLDEYEDLTPENDEQRGRAMSWLVLGVAVIGFGALAYYAYQSGTQTAANGEMLVVQADPGAVKEAPADPGGEQFPHKDKTIYDALSPYRTDGQKVETLLPTPEEPVIPEPAVGNDSEAKTAPTTSFVNKANEISTEEDERSSPPPVAKPVAKADKPIDAVTPLDKTPPAAPVGSKLETVEVKDATIAPVKKVEPAKPVVTKPVVAEVKPVVAKPVEKKPAPVAASGGDYKIQLGAYASDAEARQTWNKITAKNGDVVKGSPIVVKADVNGKTYYRLRASGFSSADAAKQACATLSSRKQACFPAGK